MAYGISISNPSTGELVISSEGAGVYCLGKGVLQSLVQPSGDPHAIGATNGYHAGYGIYRFTGLPPYFALAMALTSGRVVAVLDWVDRGGGTYDITAYNGAGAGSAGTHTVQEAAEIWAFAPLPAASSRQSQWGLALYNSAGQLTYDLTKTQLLSPVQYLPGGALTAIPGLSKPTIFGMAGSDETTDTGVSFNRWAIARLRGGWSMPVYAQVQGTKFVYSRYEYTATEAQGLDSGGDAAQAGFLLEGASLP